MLAEKTPALSARADVILGRSPREANMSVGGATEQNVTQVISVKFGSPSSLKAPIR